MNKVFSVILRIVMMLSFLGIILFVSIAILNNQNISYEAYNYIYNEKSKVQVEAFTELVDANVDLDLSGSDDPNVTLISNCLNQTSLGIDYFLDYLAFEDELSKGEQNNLISQFNSFVNYFNKSRTSLNKYLEVYKLAVEQFGESAIVQYLYEVKLIFIEDYLNCYKSAQILFESLVDCAKNYTFNTCNFTYHDLTFILKFTLAKASINEVFVKNVLPNSSSLVSSFYYYSTVGYLKYSDSQLLTNEDFGDFVMGLNSLNIYRLFSDYDNYINSLSSDFKVIAQETKDFFNINLSKGN